jgi:HPt (histidine-containing phosphotransfer) domain-containing protein
MTDILNRETLNSLRELGDDFFLELIETFLDSSQTQMEALRKAIEEKSATGIEAAAHSLKGSCYGQGAEELGLLCKEMEAKGRENDMTDIAPLIRDIEASLDQTHEVLKQLL